MTEEERDKIFRTLIILEREANSINNRLDKLEQNSGINNKADSKLENCQIRQAGEIIYLQKEISALQSSLKSSREIMTAWLLTLSTSVIGAIIIEWLIKK